MKTTANTQLPPIQKDFMNQFDGSLQSILNFDRLHLILNPCFTAHWFFISGTCDSDTVTTKDTDGSFEYWGNQTQEQMDNAIILANEIRNVILSHNPTPLEDLVGKDNHDAMRPYANKISQVRRRAAFLIDSKIILVPGLKL